MHTKVRKDLDLDMRKEGSITLLSLFHLFIISHITTGIYHTLNSKIFRKHPIKDVYLDC